jgi:hypothetical protein
MNKDNSLDEQVQHLDWKVLLTGNLLDCCERATKEGYQVERGLFNGFLLHLPNSPHYATLMPMKADDVRNWELISWRDYKPTGNEKRLHIYSNRHD